MESYADLEIGLHRRSVDSYSIELRCCQPDSDADIRLSRRGPAVARFDLDRLREYALDAAAYGRCLTSALFADTQVQSAFAEARGVAQSLNAPLRVRLFVGASAPELHDLRWETLRDPQDMVDGEENDPDLFAHSGDPLLTSERILFSRYLMSLDWRPVRLRPKTDLRALVVIANPTNLIDYRPGGRRLSAVDVDGELARARSSLGEIQLTVLASGGRATLDNVDDGLRNGCDLLYLVCHGALIGGEPHLWLEDESGQVNVVSGGEWTTRLRELERQPRLIVLASCQSAGSGDETCTGDGGALAALGPRLSEAGVPAVLAMQGNVTMETVARFMPALFRELQQHGQIDRAVAVARGKVRERSDWWAPALYMRLKSGRLWYTPGFADLGRGRGAEKWPVLISHIQQQKCTPILGPGLTESLLGSRREIARRWADAHHFPMQPHNREDLAQVAQYLRTFYQDYYYPRTELSRYLRQEITRRCGGELPDELRGTSLDDLIVAIGRQARKANPAEPYRVLAHLPLPVYITTDPSDLLADALAAAGKDPQVEICCWRPGLESLPSVYDREPDYSPTPERPLVYHLFGRLNRPASVVLSEDDYFDYLIGRTQNSDLVPFVVRKVLTNTALLFLGFQMEDWDFRVLYRSLMMQEGHELLRRYAHVAAQIDPEQGRILEPERARRYLESYFGDANISIYWGSAGDLAGELWERWQGGVR